MVGKKRWVVFLGHLGKEHILEQLRSRRLVVLDEISLPMRHWKFIRDDKAFSEVVKEIRDNEIGLGEKTQGSTFSGTLTETVNPLAEEELTKEPKTSGVFGFENIVAQRKPNEELSFAYQKDPKLREELGGTGQTLLKITILVLILALGFIGYTKFFRATNKADTSALEILKQADVAFRVGEYKEALELYRRAHERGGAGDSYYFRYGLLLVHMGETVQGRRVFDLVLRNRQASVQLGAQIINALGVADLVDGDQSKAEKRFNNAMEVDKNYFPAYLNMVISLIQRRQYESAHSRLLDILGRDEKNSVAYFLYAEAQIHLWHRDKNSSYLLQAIDEMKKNINISSSYFQESQLVQSYLYFLLGDQKNLHKSLEKFVDADPQQSEMFRKNLQIHSSGVSWNLLSQWCAQMASHVQLSSYLELAMSLCTLKNGQNARALGGFERLANQTLSSALVLASLSYALGTSDKKKRSSVEAEKAYLLNQSQANQYLLPMRVKAKDCLNNLNWSCVYNVNSKILQVEPQSLIAQFGLSQFYFEQKNFTQANKYLSAGLFTAPEFGPFLKLNEKIKVSK